MTTSRRTFLKTGIATGLTTFSAPAFANNKPFPPKHPVNDAIADSSLKKELPMRFRGETPEECRQWQKRFHAKLSELLGDFEPPAKWNMKEERRTELSDHVRYELLLHADGVPEVPVYLLLPPGASQDKKVPGVLCVHGHGRFGHHTIVGRTDLPGVAADVEKLHYNYGLQFVRRGYAVAAPCMIPFGRRVDRQKYGGNDPCAVTFVRMQALGQLPMAANLRDLRWSIDLLQNRPEVAADRIGCAGLSYGGRMTMLVSAMDERIQVTCISGALNLLQERMTLRHSCGSQIIPGLLNYGDYSEIGSLIAPRPAVWEVGSTDGLITERWADLFKERLKRAYAALGKPDRLHFDHFEGGHRWNGEMAFPLFDEVLKG